MSEVKQEEREPFFVETILARVKHVSSCHPKLTREILSASVLVLFFSFVSNIG